MDLNISHYSNQELIQLLGLDTLTEDSVRMTIRYELSKYPENKDYQTFFNSIQERLLEDIKTRSINPEQKNIITRIVHIDSSHVPLHVENFSTDKFSFQLSDQINNVVSISLLSVEIPQSWYTFAYLKGNTRFVFYSYTKKREFSPYDDEGLTYYVRDSEEDEFGNITYTYTPISSYTMIGQDITDENDNVVYHSGDVIDSAGTLITTVYKKYVSYINGESVLSTDYIKYNLDKGYVTNDGSSLYSGYFKDVCENTFGQSGTDPAGYFTDSEGNIVNVSGMDVSGNLVDTSGNVLAYRYGMDEYGNMKDADGNIFVYHSAIRDTTYTNITDATGYFTDVCGNVLSTSGMDASGNILDESGNVVAYRRDASGNLLYDTDGRMLDASGNIIIFHSGMDSSGNLLDEFGNLLYTFVQNEPVSIFTNSLVENHYTLEIPDGNYTTITLLDKFKSLINVYDTTFDYTIVKHSGRVIFTSESSFKLLWHDASSTEPWLNLSYTNHHLGYYLGFNTDFTNSELLSSTDEEAAYVTNTGEIYHSFFSPTVMNFNGTRYIILDLNDFSSNRISNNIVLMNSLPRNKIFTNAPFKQDLPQVITGYNSTGVLTSNSTKNVRNAQINLVNNYAYTPSTGKQLIVRQASNLFAKIPLKRNAFLVYNKTSTDSNKDEVPELGYARHFCELTGSLQGNVREYLGPITLCNIEVALYDDKGFLLGLNGMHWSCSIVVKSIYQKK